MESQRAAGVLQGRAPCNPATPPQNRAAPPPQHPPLCALKTLPLKDSSAQSLPTHLSSPREITALQSQLSAARALPSGDPGMDPHTWGSTKGFPGTVLQAGVPSLFLHSGVHYFSRAAHRRTARTQQWHYTPNNLSIKPGLQQKNEMKLCYQAMIYSDTPCLQFCICFQSPIHHTHLLLQRHQEFFQPITKNRFHTWENSLITRIP